MRRADREVTIPSEIYGIMEKCEILELALNDEDGFPYVIPMNFGFALENDAPVIYLHGAKEGKKLDLIKKDSRCAFSMSTSHELILGKVACAATWKYESVCGKGRIAFIEGGEGIRALTELMRKYDPEHEHVFDERHLKAVSVMKIEIEQLTGKRRMTK
ncbi:MAG: pyridoxamine 5'-phosphate oxidase family protein [Clostridia bacterium]|nr:pyridoxamine 5'-phosphate oxidase family protein [Clostridia bacterium]